MRLQRTLKKEVTFEGIGLHTGKFSKVTMIPAPRDTGIVFIRADKGVSIKAHFSSVIDTAFATTLGYNGAKIRTVEHILAALAGLGIDNLIIKVNGTEIPVLDGSSTILIDIILKAGIAKQAKKMPYIRITNPVFFEDGHSQITALPYNGRRLTYRMNFDHSMLGEQIFSLELNEGSFTKEIAPARTFGFLKDVESLRANGFAKGGSLDNAVIVSKDGILNSSGLRFKDEFVRHKILDMIGDFSLIGYPVFGHIFSSKSGHSTNLKFLKKMFANPCCWEIVSGITEQHALVCA